MTTPHRSVRLLSKDSTELNTLTGESGEILYDSTFGVLRLYDGSTVGGAQIATQAFVSSSITTQTNSKAPIASPTFTGTVTIPAGASIAGYAPLASPTFTGTVSGITATMVGLGNVTNESKSTMFTDPTFTGTVSITSINATTVNATNITVGGQNIKSLAIAMAAALS